MAGTPPTFHLPDMRTDTENADVLHRSSDSNQSCLASELDGLSA